MQKTGFFEEISKYVKNNWKLAVHDAEERFSRESLGSKEQINIIKGRAQLQIIRGLVDIKGEWLSVHELQYTLDLFAVHASSVDYFEILKFESTSILSAARQFVSVENN